MFLELHEELIPEKNITLVATPGDRILMQLRTQQQNSQS
jgi:hypothetical protein